MRVYDAITINVVKLFGMEPGGRFCLGELKNELTSCVSTELTTTVGVKSDKKRKILRMQKNLKSDRRHPKKRVLATLSAGRF